MPNYVSSYTGAEIDAAVGAVQSAVAADGIVNTNGLDTILGNYLTTSAAAAAYAPLTGTGTSGTWPISIDGSAVSLKNTRTIWGNSFNGTADINGHIILDSQKYLYMTYNNSTYYVLYNHNNGNVSLNACSDGLYIGYYNTTLINWLNGKMSLNSNGDLSTARHITCNGLFYQKYNGITVTFGAQNTSWVHIYSDTNVPFIFNRTICSTSGDCGHSSYPWNSVIIKSGGRIHANGGNLYIGNSNNAGWVLVQDICSHSGAGDTYWSARVGGTLHANSYVTNSSIRIKKNIKDISNTDCLKLLELKPVTFEYKKNLDNHLRHAGLIAEDVEKIMPEIVLPPEDEKSLLGIRYIEIIAYTIKLLQIQNQEIEDLKSRITSLENKNLSTI